MTKQRTHCRYCKGGSVDLIGHEENCVMRPPDGFRLDPFADARMGKSLFEMDDADWLVKEPRS